MISEGETHTMEVNHKVIRVQKYLLDIADEEKFVVGVELTKEKLLERFATVKTDQLEDIYSPKVTNGINSIRNTIGEFKPNKSKPKEMCWRSQEWHVRDWGGNPHSGISYIPYMRYQRDFIEPREIRFSLSHLSTGQTILLANAVFQKSKLTDLDLDKIKFIINLLVEADGKAEIFPLDHITKMPVRVIKTVNWQILPKGERIWKYVKHGTEQVSKSEKHMIKARLKVLESYFPDEIYQGFDSYSGYLVFYFKRVGLYVFDSIIYGKATYVFKGHWKDVSQLTKKQIIENKLAEARIIHNNEWQSKLNKLLSNDNVNYENN